MKYLHIKKVIIIFTIFIFIFLIYNYIQISKFHINKVNLKSNKIKNHIKITQISDFHSNKLIDMDKLMDSIVDFSPDIIAITGDFIDSKTEDLSLAFHLIDRLKPIKARIFFVAGNHELRNKKAGELYEKLEASGMIILDDSKEIIDIDGTRLRVYGSSFFAGSKDYRRLFENMDAENYNLLLTHSPYRIIKYLNDDLDLILSGHTHGGQVRLPLIGALVSPGGGFFPKYDKGLFQLGNTTLHIDSGLGNSLWPIRFFNRVQISNIKIENSMQ